MVRRLNPAALVGVVALVAVLGWPAQGYRARPGLDPSWQLGATFAHVRGLTYGDDVLFNFGPLGFVNSPIVGGGRWFLLGVAGQIGLVVGIALAVFAALRIQGAGRRGALATTAAVMLIAPTNTSLAELVLLAVGIVIVLGRCHGLVWGWPVWALLGVLAASLTLVKISTGPALLVLVVLGAAIDDGAVAAVGAALASAVVAFVGWWVALGQPLGEIGNWVSGSFEIVVGHTAAMSTGSPGALWQYSALVCVLAGSGALLVVAARRAPHGRASTVHTLVCGAMVAVLVGFFVKQGFVRRDGHAAVFFFAAAVGLVATVPWTRSSRAIRAGGGALVALCVVCFVAIEATPFLRLVNPIRPVVDAVVTADLLVRADARVDANLEANAEARAEYGVPARIVELVGDHPVHVDPWEITIAWAHGWTWRPVPTMQGYLGYTPSLDERNAGALLAQDGPRFVVRSPHGPIDGRFPLTDGPAYHIALLCNFTSVYVDAEWQLFERSGPRCGPLVAERTVDVGSGDVVELPVPADGRTAVLVSIDYEQTLLEGLATLVLKPPSAPQLVVGEQSYRMVAATATTPGLVVVPESAGWGARIDPFADPIRSIAVDRPATVTVSTMTVSTVTVSSVTGG